jgi:hypothetical protein
MREAFVIRTAAAAFVAVGLLCAQAASGQAAKPAVGGPVPVPRTDFLQTMDAEFGKMDADKDKVLTKIEVEQFQRAVALAEGQARARALFNQLDADRNGQLSPTEFGKMAVAPPQPNAAPVLTQSDLNRDGRITLVEYRTAKLANFDRMDTDKDGIVTVPEMKAAGLVK